MLSVSRRPQQTNQKNKAKYYLENGKNKAEPEEARRYAYLSIDPKTQMGKNSLKIDSTLQSSEFLNVKFDTKRELRQTYILKFKEQMASKGIRFSNATLSEKICNQAKSFMQSHSKTKKGKKGEYLRRSCEKIMQQRQQKILSLYDKQAIDEQSLKEKDQMSTLILPDTINISHKDDKSAKSRKNIFHKMLKKCDKLKEIYRYENELVSMIEAKKQCSIKFYTQPFLVSSNSNPYDFPKRKLSNIEKLNKAKTLFQNQNRLDRAINGEIDSIDDLNTLDVRKYNNVSSVKKRMKFFMRQKLIKQQYRIDSKTTSKKNAGTTQKRKEKQDVGPWQSQTPFC